MMLKVLFWLSFVFVTRINAGPLWNKYLPYLELPAVERFREYLRIDTSKEENLRHAVEFWIRQSQILDVPYAIYLPSGKPIFVATWEGTDPSLPSIMLNSHMDVVKAEEEEWSHPPFEAYMDDKGDIYARGTQDTKDVGILYFEAIRKLKKENVTLARTLHVTMMPDEETGGKNGMKTFIKTPQFKALNVGFALDEGLATISDTLLPSFLDKRAWQMEFEIRGEGGHGYKMQDNSAMDNVYKFIKAVMAYRDKQKEIVKQKTVDADDASGYSSVNINVINGGLAENIIPSHFTLIVDIRLATQADPEEMQSIVNSWLEAAGNETKVTYIRRETKSGITTVDDSNPYWVSMANTLDSMGMKYKPIVLPATTDVSILRNMGIPSIGFSSKINTIPRAHDKDEYQNVETFLNGINIYTEIIKNLGNIPAF